MWENGRVVPFLERIWPEGHSPTNFKNWKTAENPYQVNIFILYVLYHHHNCKLNLSKLVFF